MYSKEKSKEIFDDGWKDHSELISDEKLILIEDPKIAVLFSGSSVLCVPIKYSKNGVLIGYDLKRAVTADNWYISNEVIYEPYGREVVAIAVGLEQFLWRTAPNWSKKNHRKYF
jgi:hypothetical protein